MTTEHFTLQSARGIINSEIVARVNMYFVTLSSLIVALAFLAQIEGMRDVLLFFSSVAFPALLILGFTSFARIRQLGTVDFVYLRAINRVRRFYADQAPELHDYLLFPPHDDDLSIGKYGGYGFSVMQNLLSMGFLVLVVNTLLAAGLIAALVYSFTALPLWAIIAIALVSFAVIFVVSVRLSLRIDADSRYAEYKEIRFPAKKNR